MTVNETDGGRPAARPLSRRDVVFAVRRAAPTRRRFPWRRWVVGVTIVLATGAGGWWLTQSGVFAVSRLGTGAYRFTDERALKSALSPLLGRNLWALGAADVRKALAPLPWVREVYVQRRLPGAVDLELIEWRPLLVVAEPGAPADAPTLVLVEDGRVLPFPPKLPAPDLPVLTGVLVERSAHGPARLPVESVPQVLELVAALESSGLEAVRPVDFVVAGPEGFDIVLRGKEATLMVGRDQFEDRLTRYLTARAHVDSNLVVDLRFKDRLTVRPMPVVEVEDEDAEDVEGGKGAEDAVGDTGGAAAKSPGSAPSTRTGNTAQDNRQRQDKAGAGRRPATKERA